MDSKAAISSESSVIVSILWFIRDVPFVEQLVSLAHNTKRLRRSLSDGNQVVADPLCLIQINSPADYAIKNGSRLGSIAPAENFDGKRFAINHASQDRSPQPTQQANCSTVLLWNHVDLSQLPRRQLRHRA